MWPTSQGEPRLHTSVVWCTHGCWPEQGGYKLPAGAGTARTVLLRMHACVWQYKERTRGGCCAEACRTLLLTAAAPCPSTHRDGAVAGPGRGRVGCHNGPPLVLARIAGVQLEQVVECLGLACAQQQGCGECAVVCARARVLRVGGATTTTTTTTTRARGIWQQSAPTECCPSPTLLPSAATASSPAAAAAAAHRSAGRIRQTPGTHRPQR